MANPPSRFLSKVSFLVREYDEAIAFFVDKLQFHVVEDTPLGDGADAEKRWVVVSPGSKDRDKARGQGATALLLARASTPEQEAAVGRQGGGRVFLFLETDDLWSDYRRMEAAGVVFEEQPREEAYGTVAVFQDLYGNRWDLIQPAGER